MRQISAVGMMILLVSGSLGGLTGCSGLFKWLIQKPEVSLDEVKVENIGFSGATVLFGFKVANPNSYSLKLSSLDYNLEIGDRPISQGKLDTPQEVEAKSSKVIWIPVPVKFNDLFSSLKDFFRKGNQTYRIRGVAKISSFSLPFDHKGELKMNDESNP